MNYLLVTHRRNLLTWAWAVLAAVLINAALFFIMPMLQNHDCSDTAPLEIISGVELIRPPPREKIREKEKPKKIKKITRSMRPPEPVNTSIKPRPLDLPFRIDPGFQPAMKALATLPMDFAFSKDIKPEGIFSVDDLDAPVGVLVRMEPAYPMRAKHRRIEGWVKVKLLVNESGQVTRAEIVEADQPGYFEKSVLNCVRKWKFKAPTVAGNPVSVWMETKITFTLE